MKKSSSFADLLMIDVSQDQEEVNIEMQVFDQRETEGFEERTVCTFPIFEMYCIWNSEGKKLVSQLRDVLNYKYFFVRLGKFACIPHDEFSDFRDRQLAHYCHYYSSLYQHCLTYGPNIVKATLSHLMDVAFVDFLEVQPTTYIECCATDVLRGIIDAPIGKNSYHNIYVIINLVKRWAKGNCPISYGLYSLVEVVTLPNVDLSSLSIVLGTKKSLAKKLCIFLCYEIVKWSRGRAISKEMLNIHISYDPFAFFSNPIIKFLLSTYE